MNQIYIYGFMISLIVLVYLYSRSKNNVLDKIPSDAIIIDVRTPGEFSSGAISSAVNIPVSVIAKEQEKILSLTKGEKDKTIVVYCASGIRSKMAQASLKAAGFKSVINGGSYARLERRI